MRIERVRILWHQEFYLARMGWQEGPGFQPRRQNLR
jgi:hypothetical protein